MGAGQAAEIARTLIAAGKPRATPVAIVENASLPQARTIFATLETLPGIADANLSGPALILIGPQYRARATAADAAPDVAAEARRSA